MKSEDVLKAIGNVDDQMIIDAEMKSDSKEIKVVEVSRKTKVKRIIAWSASAAAVLVAGFCIFATGMFRAGKAAPMEAMKSDEAYYEMQWAESETPMAAPRSVEGAGSVNLMNKATDYDYAVAEEKEMAYDSGMVDYSSQVSPIVLDKNVKLVYTAYMDLQTEDFDASLSEIQKLVAEKGGYFERSDLYNGSYYYQNDVMQSGNYTVRIPTEYYDWFLNALGGTCHVVNLSQNVENIGQQYYEVEGRLKTLRIKEDRLHELLEKAENISDIITIEGELSNTEWQIDNYSTDLNRYDSLVNYSTIHISLEEVKQYTDSNVEKESFGTKFVRSLKRGARNFVNSCENFAMWFGRNIITLVILAGIVFVICKFHLIRRIFRRRK